MRLKNVAARGSKRQLRSAIIAHQPASCEKSRLVRRHERSKVHRGTPLSAQCRRLDPVANGPEMGTTWNEAIIREISIEMGHHAYPRYALFGRRRNRWDLPVPELPCTSRVSPVVPQGLMTPTFPLRSNQSRWQRSYSQLKFHLGKRVYQSARTVERGNPRKRRKWITCILPAIRST